LDDTALARIEVQRARASGASSQRAVDFKFSAGWHRRALIELKLLSSPALLRGAEAQLPEYLASEQASCAYYVCLGFTDHDLRPERLERTALYERHASTLRPHYLHQQLVKLRLKRRLHWNFAPTRSTSRASHGAG
jgi:hypothetical protein